MKESFMINVVVSKHMYLTVATFFVARGGVKLQLESTGYKQPFLFDTKNAFFAVIANSCCKLNSDVLFGKYESSKILL